jgi:hypothetical protein
MSKYVVDVVLSVSFEVEAADENEAETAAFNEWWDYKHNIIVDDIDVTEVEDYDDDE